MFGARDAIAPGRVRSLASGGAVSAGLGGVAQVGNLCYWSEPRGRGRIRFEESARLYPSGGGRGFCAQSVSMRGVQVGLKLRCGVRQSAILIFFRTTDFVGWRAWAARARVVDALIVGLELT